MADYKNIPLGLRTQTQIPLDVKEYIQNESLLSNLGVNGQLAYTYTKGLVVYCIKESTRWEWTEVKPGLEDTGLINQDFIYPDNHIAFGIDYSNKRYNFVKVISGSETKINSGTNVSITGNGTVATPYIINSVTESTPTYINPGANITVTGNGDILTPYIISSTNGTPTDGSETKINQGNGISVTGTGTTLNPYIINKVSPYKVYTARLYQTGTNPPTVLEIYENTLGFIPIWEYQSIGTYVSNNSGYIANKTCATISNASYYNISPGAAGGFAIFAGANRVTITTISSSGGMANSVIGGMIVEIRIYN